MRVELLVAVRAKIAEFFGTVIKIVTVDIFCGMHYKALATV